MWRLSLIPGKIKHFCYLQMKVRWESFICIEHEKPSALPCQVCGILKMTVMREMWGTPHSSVNSIQSYICLYFLFFIKFNHKSCPRYPYDPCNHYLKFTILISNSPKWRPAWQCKHWDLVKWNNKTQQWHFVDILYVRPINGMVKVLFQMSSSGVSNLSQVCHDWQHNQWK